LTFFNLLFRNWLSQIETVTYDPVSFGYPLWLDSQFSIRIFRENVESESGEFHGLDDSRPRANLSDLPGSVALEVKREMPKPYGYVFKTTAAFNILFLSLERSINGIF
jgi:hypothetical protein